MAMVRPHKHLRVSPATHRRLMIEAAIRGRTAFDLAEELLSRALQELPAVTGSIIQSSTTTPVCDR